MSSHDQEVSAFLASSRDVVERCERHVERIWALVATSRAVIQQGMTISERFARHIEEIRAFMAGARHAGNGNPPSSRLEETLLATSEKLNAACEELRQARRLLEREHAKYVDVVENEPIATLITDAKATVREANHAAAAMLGVQQQALPGRLLVAFVARQDIEHFHAFARPLGLAQESEIRSLSLRIRPRGAAVVRARLSVNPVRGISRTSVGLRWTISREVAAA